VLLDGKWSGKVNAGVSFQKVACPTCSVSRNIALMEDKELTTRDCNFSIPKSRNYERPNPGILGLENNAITLLLCVKYIH